MQQLLGCAHPAGPALWVINYPAYSRAFVLALKLATLPAPALEVRVPTSVHLPRTCWRPQ